MPRGLSNLTIDLAAVSSAIPLNLKGVKDIKYMISQYIGRREPRTLRLATSGKATRAEDSWWRDNALKNPSAIADPLTKLHYYLDVCELSGCGHLLIYDEEEDEEVMLGACLSEKGIGGHEDMATGVVDKLVLLDDRFYVGLANFDDNTTEFKELTRVDLKIRDLATLKRLARSFSVTRRSDGSIRIGVMTRNKRPFEPYYRAHDDQEDASDSDSPFGVTEIHVKDEGSDWVTVPTWPSVWSVYADVQFVTPDVILLDDRAPCSNGKQRSNLTLLRLIMEGEPRVEELSRLRLDCWPSACLLSPCGLRIKVYVSAEDEDYDVQICY